MPKFNADEEKQLAEPIEVTLNGKNYSVSKITTELMDKIDEIAKSGENPATAPCRQLALIFGTEPAEFKDVDIRTIGKILTFVTSSIAEGVSKNV